MDHEIQLVTDGDGLAVIGDKTAVESFLHSVGLLSSAKDLGLDKLGFVLRAGAGVAQAGSEIAANSAMYLKLTPESAQFGQEVRADGKQDARRQPRDVRDTGLHQ